MGISTSQDLDSLNLKGEIAYIGNDFNVYSVDFASGNRYQLTDDGTDSAKYEFPTWSANGQLAYFCCAANSSELPQLSIYISQDGHSNGEVLYDERGKRHVYAYWSPVKCFDINCVDLSVLVQDFSQSQLRVELFNSNDLRNGQRTLGDGLPLYYSWSPIGDSIVMHRNNNLLQYYSVDTANIDKAFDQSLGNFLSPSWSPIDNRILFAKSTTSGLSQLATLNEDQIKILSEEFEGVASFSWSPDGKYIAYRIIQPESLSSIFVINANTGDLISQSNVSGVISFFWSPDSTKIAYVTLSNPPGTFDIENETVGDTTYLAQTIDGFAWNILNIDDNTNILLNSFIPSFEMQYILTNFDQFAQSHRFWSPDSMYLVYSDRVNLESQQSVIKLINVENPNIEPVELNEGFIAIWSFHED